MPPSVRGNLTARDGNAQLTGFSWGQGVRRERRAVAPPRCVGEHRGGRWELSWAYERVVRVSETRYGTPAPKAGAVLRGAFREVSGAGVRVRLGYVEKSVPSRLYGSVLDGVSEGLRNLTDDLTAGLTGRLTDRLTHGLTE